MLVQPGDTLVIPKKLETVRMRGHLLNPTSLRYKKNKSTKYYINNSGGFKARADKSKTYVIYPNGEARATKKFLFFNIYPKIVAGSEIRVPEKLTKKPSTDVGVSHRCFYRCSNVGFSYYSTQLVKPSPKEETK